MEAEAYKIHCLVEYPGIRHMLAVALAAWHILITKSYVKSSLRPQF